MTISRAHGIFLLIAGCGLFGQQPTDHSSSREPSSGEPRITLNVRQVLVPVTVTDRKGTSITGLRASDFQVAEDGVSQEIVAFTEELSANTQRPDAPEPEHPPSAVSGSGGKDLSAVPGSLPQTWVICFDALHTSFASFVKARTTLDRLFEKGPQTGDQFVLLSLGRQLRVMQPATRDVSLIRSKLEGKDFTRLIGVSETGQLESAINDVRRRMDIYCTRCPCGRDASHSKSVCDVELQRIRQNLDARSEQFAMFSTTFFAGLKRVVEELAKLDGHRRLLLVSDGFTLMPGRELYATASAYLPNSAYFIFDPARNMQPSLDESLKVAAAHDVIVSTIDTRGIFSPSFRPGGLGDASNAAPGSTGRQEMLANGAATNALRGGSLLVETDSKWSSVQQENGSVLAQLAAATGGLYFHNSNDLLKGFREVLEDRSETYSLAYVPKNLAADGKFRHITVSVNAAGVKAGNMVVRNKLGYWAESPPR